MVINPWNLDALQELEEETGRRVYTILQLRVHPKLLALREKLSKENGARQHKVSLTYVTSRGAWYHVSWKGSVEKSGGVTTNIGIHFFDLLSWLFGSVGDCRVYHSDSKRMGGFLELERAKVKWFLSVDTSDLPYDPTSGDLSTYRSIIIDGEEIEFTDGFSDLHTRVYEETLAGRGFGIGDAQPAINLVHRTAPLSPLDDMTHPFLVKD